MQTRRSAGVVFLSAIFLLVGVSLAVLIEYYPQMWGLQSGGFRQTFWLLVVAAMTFLSVSIVVAAHVLGRQSGGTGYTRQIADDMPSPVPSRSTGEQVQPSEQLKEHLHQHYGPFWRLRVRLLLVVGEPKQIAAIVPGLEKTPVA